MRCNLKGALLRGFLAIDESGFASDSYGVPEGSKSTEVVDHSVYAYFDIHVHV